MVDVTIIGAGVIGSAIARELAKYKLDVVVLEREEDVCSGSSKANSAIVHAGFDAKPGTLKAKLNVEGNRMLDELAKELDIPFIRNGSLVVRTKNQDRSGLEDLLDKANKNGVPGCRIIDREELLKMEPNIADDVVDALYAPTGGIVCPFNMTIAFAENAYDNGVQFMMNTKVTDIKKTENGYIVSAVNKEELTIETKAVVNAAGLYSDVFNNMVSSHHLQIIPRSGEYMLLDSTVGDYVHHTIFQLPDEMGKGILVSPTVHGNLLLGPTAKNLENKEATNTTAAGLETVRTVSALSVKNVPYREVITSFCGLRAHEVNGDFVLGEAEDAPLFFNAAGVESPGLSSAPAIAVYIVDQIAERLNAKKNEDFNGRRVGMKLTKSMSDEELSALIQENPAYGQIVCRCCSVTEGEIVDAITRSLGARSLDGIKRRTRAQMGRCQGGFCTPKIMDIIRNTLSDYEMTDIRKSGSGSELVVGYNKKI